MKATSAGASGAGTSGSAAGGAGNAGESSNAGAGNGGNAAGSGGSGGSSSGPPLQRPKRTADEVLVVYNSNSAVSQAVAMDYALKRQVPNTLAIQCPDSAVKRDNETIALADFKTKIAAPIQSYLAAHPKIDFVVLTKGVPIRIDGAPTGCCQGNVDNHPNGSGQPSVDSFLAAIDYPQIADAKQIGITGSGTVGSGWLNRYWNAKEPFSHAKFGGYIVTRLDGYTQADAQALVTRALAAEQTMPTGSVLLDLDGARGLGDKTMEPAPVTDAVTSEWGWETWNADMLDAHDELEASGVANLLDLTTTFVGGKAGLAGYFSWGSNDANFGMSPASGQDPTLVSGSAPYESLMFAPGSLADTAVSTSGRTFLKPFDPGQSLMADLIAHGLTCGKAYVGEPLLQGIASPSIALDRYYSGYSAAESLYAASRFTGWEDVIFGDPLGTPYAAARPPHVPIYAANYDSASSGPQREDCAEGGSDVGFIDAGAFTAYKGVNLDGAHTFVVRFASAGPGGNVEVHLDGQTGATVAICSITPTGDYQSWSTQTCALTAGAGTHDLYLVYTGQGSALFNVEWFSVR